MKVQLWQASDGRDSHLPPPLPVLLWPPKPPSWRQNLLGKSLGKNTIDSALLELDEVGVVLSRRSCTRCCSWQATAGWQTNLRRIRKWREIQSLHFLIILSLYPFPISKIVTFCRKMLNTALLSRMSQKHRKNCKCCPGHYLSTSVY